MTTIVAAGGPEANATAGFLPLRLALRDLRGGLSGFYILIVCIALGAGAIGAINSLSAALQSALAREGKVLLGGDAEASVIHRQAQPDERAFLESLGRLSEVATLRSMARKPEGEGQALIDLKAVDRAYPLYGTLALKDRAEPQAALFGGPKAVVDRSLLEQLDLKIGDRIIIGNARPEITAVIEREPDRLAAGPAFGARVLVSQETLKETGLVQPGSLVRWSYRIRQENTSAVGSIKEQISEKLPEAGFRVRDSSDPSPGVSDTIKRLTEFLTLVGLTAMLAGGIGVANAISAFLDRKRRTIAAYKALGASQRLILQTVFLEAGIMAAIGIALGLAIAIAIPVFAGPALKALLPLDIDFGIYPGALAIAALFGVLTSLPFILWPLGRATEIRAAELLRDQVEEQPGFPPVRFRIAAAAAAFALAAAAIILSGERFIAAYTCAGLFFVFVFFWGAGSVFRRLAARTVRPRQPELALALANMGGPGSLARTVALSLGTGLTLLTTVSLVDASLTSELSTRLPDQAPSHFFIGIPKNEQANFRALVERTAPEARLTAAPMLRGRIVELRGTPVDQFEAPADAQWVLNGDRGLTFSETVPADSEVRTGAWWPPDYSGEPLVSFDIEIAQALGLEIGDTVTVNVLGRNVTARIANFRTVKWESLEINFVMIFSPNTLAAAPYNYLGTLNWPEDARPDDKAEAAIIRAVADAYPTVTSVRVRDAINAINAVLERVMLAIRAAGSVTLITGALVLAGALITAQRRRIYEAVILKTLGATPLRIALSHLAEYLMLALSLSLFAGLLGIAAAWLLVTEIMELSFSISIPALLQPSLIATIFIVVLGAAGTYRVLAARPAQYLRSE